MNALENEEFNEVIPKLNVELSNCRRITVTLLEVQDLSNVNHFTEMSSTCSEFNMNLIGVQCQSAIRINLENVKIFNVESAKYEPKTNTFPPSMTHLTFQLKSLDTLPKMDIEFFQVFKLLRTCTFHHVEIPSLENETIHVLPLLEKLQCHNCRIQNIHSLLKFPNLTILESNSCFFPETPYFYTPKEEHFLKLKELTITNMKSGKLNLQILKNMQLEQLNLSQALLDSNFRDHLHFIENMPSLTYLNLSNENQVLSEILKHMNFERLTNLNYLIMKYHRTSHRRDLSFKLNSSIYHLIHHTSMIFPIISSETFINIEPDKYHHGGEMIDIPILTKEKALQIVTKFIPRSYQEQEGEILTVLYCREYHYITFSLQGKFGYVLVKNEPSRNYPIMKGQLTKENVEQRYLLEYMFRIPSSVEKYKMKCDII
ncbi:hypothetical protein FDP41_001487 [Naegleria fowleri]|nr:uncharacterized protein FDP41_001487 [Naegleria fowleri]KAF0979509.1 hypothetical protein FDP41_001487 [Naegleria fowleri]